MPRVTDRESAQGKHSCRGKVTVTTVEQQGPLKMMILYEAPEVAVGLVNPVNETAPFVMVRLLAVVYEGGVPLVV